jgi:cation:H+ antiporter
MLLLGGITSLPEIANVLTASTRGVPALAVNNLLGSAAINILLLAVADVVIGRQALTSVVAAPATMMMGALCMLVLGAVAVAVTVGDVAVAGVGLWSMTICAASVGSFALATSYGRRAPWIVKPEEQQEQGGEEKPPEASLFKLMLVAAVTAVLIFGGGYFLSELGDTLAKQTGLGAGFVGFLLIGLATSMPELSSISTAIKIRRYEMAFGQVLGTNFVNLSLFLLADVAYRGGPIIGELGDFEVLSALLGLILIGIFQIGLLERRNPVMLRAGYDSLAVIVLFLGGVGLLYAVR